MERIRVTIVENQASIRAGYEALLATQDDIEVIGTSANGNDGIRQALTLRPDVVLMDIHMPAAVPEGKSVDGFAATAQILREWPTARILILTNWDGDENIFRARQAGAKGYILKDAEFNDILRAIRTLHAGREYIWSEIAGQLSEREFLPRLTPVEVEILRLMATGASNDDIASTMRMSVDQVKTTNVRMFRKLGVANRIEAVNIGRRRGIIPPGDYQAAGNYL